jgi:hypothetical protein
MCSGPISSLTALLNAMAHQHGDPATVWELFWRSELPLRRRLAVAARNIARRLTTPPHDCCGHPGEPGC